MENGRSRKKEGRCEWVEVEEASGSTLDESEFPHILLLISYSLRHNIQLLFTYTQPPLCRRTGDETTCLATAQ